MRRKGQDVQAWVLVAGSVMTESVALLPADRIGTLNILISCAFARGLIASRVPINGTGGFLLFTILHSIFFRVVRFSVNHCASLLDDLYEVDTRRAVHR